MSVCVSVYVHSIFSLSLCYFVKHQFQLFSMTHSSLEAEYASAGVQVVQADSEFSQSDPQPDEPSSACELHYNSCL